MNNADEYQDWTSTTAVFKVKDTMSYLTLGLTGEAGEVANKIKKVLRDKDGVMDEATRLQLIDEMGDVMWYVAQLCAFLGADLSQVMEMNKAKLESRKDRNTLAGEGDNR